MSFLKWARSLSLEEVRGVNHVRRLYGPELDDLLVQVFQKSWDKGLLDNAKAQAMYYFNKRLKDVPWRQRGLPLTVHGDGPARQFLARLSNEYASTSGVKKAIIEAA